MQPIAIVGLACRFPKAPNAGAFWRMLCEGGDGIGPVPPERWDADAFFSEDPKAPGKTTSRTGGFIEDIDRFDPQFWGISPREAVQIDPQQRILLELAYEALEDAGIASASLSRSDTAVYVGVMNNDYLRYQTAEDYRRIDVHTGGGAGFCMLANRLSYHFDFNGPSMAVDSACSSSLVAIFEGCHALWSGRSQLALAGGSNLMLDPIFNVFYAKGGLLSPDGRCRTFSAKAAGIGRGEGAGLVVLKRLADAQRDGDEVYAVVRGGAVNHDGRSNGMTAPNRWAQEKLLRTAWSHAGVTGQDFDYIELHGTATALGDTIEANALGTSLLGDGRTQPCLVGSVKTNIGHLEAAAGVAGFIKLALSLRHGAVVPSLWFDEPNPTIDFQTLQLQVNTKHRTWETRSPHAPRLGGISSFGLGGTNAHLVLESPPPAACAGAAQACDPAPELLVLSAKNPSALRAQAAQVHDFLEGDGVDVAAVCMTAMRRRNLHDHRLHVLGGDSAQLRQALLDYLEGRPSARVVAGRFKAAARAVEVAVPHASTIVPAKLARWLVQAPLGRAAWRVCHDAVNARGERRLPALDELAVAAVPIDERTLRLWCFVAQYAVLAQLVATLPPTATLVPDGHGQLAALCAAGAISPAAALEWLDADLRHPAPETGAYRMRCDCAGGENPELAGLAWEPAADRWSRRATPGSPPITVVVNVDAAGLPVEAMYCLGPDDHDLGRLIAQLDLICPLRLSALTDERFTRLPSYPWQRGTFLLPRPTQAADARPATAANGEPAPSRNPIRASLLALEPAARNAPLLAYLLQRFSEALRVPPGQLDPQQPLNTMGIDSLTAVEVKNRIESDLKVSVPVVKFLDGFATADFAGLILDQLEKPEKTPAAQGSTARPPATAVTARKPSSPPPPSPRAPASEFQNRVAGMAINQVDDLLAQLMKNRTA